MGEIMHIVGYREDPSELEVVRIKDFDWDTPEVLEEIAKEHGFVAWGNPEFSDDDGFLIIESTKNKDRLFVTAYEYYGAAAMNLDLRAPLSAMYDVENEEFIDFGILHWNQRDRATNSQEAMEYVASRLSQKSGWVDKEMSPEEKAELQTYAEKHSVPLNLALHEEFMRVFKTEHPNWNSSNGKCPW